MNKLHDTIRILFGDLSVRSGTDNVLNITSLAQQAPVTVTSEIETFQHARVTGSDGPRFDNRQSPSFPNLGTKSIHAPMKLALGETELPKEPSHLSKTPRITLRGPFNTDRPPVFNASTADLLKGDPNLSKETKVLRNEFPSSLTPKLVDPL